MAPGRRFFILFRAARNCFAVAGRYFARNPESCASGEGAEPAIRKIYHGAQATQIKPLAGAENPCYSGALRGRPYNKVNAARGRIADVAELVDALDLGSSDESRGGSSPSARTILCCGAGEGGVARSASMRRRTV